MLLTLISGISYGQHLNGTDVRLIGGSSGLAGTSNGTLYYDVGLGQFQFRQAGAWSSLGGSPYLTINAQTASYTLVLADGTSTTPTVVQMNVAGANNLTVPPNGTVAIPIGASILIRQIGAGLTTIVQGAGVTVTPTSGSLNLAGQNFSGLLIKTGTNTWTLDNGSPSLVSADITTALGFTPWSTSGTTTLSAASPSIITQTVATSGATPFLQFNLPANTTQTAAEVNHVSWNLNSTYQFTGSTGFALERSMLIQPTTYAFVSATGTITDGYTVAIATAAGGSGAPAAGTNAAITNKYTIGAWTTSGLFRVSNTLSKTVNIGGVGININNGGINLLANNSDAASSSTIQVGTVSNVTNITTAASNSTLTLNVSSVAQTSGTNVGITETVAVAPTSGTGIFKYVSIQGNTNMTGGANGNVIALDMIPAITAAGANFTGIDYNPTVTTVTGVHYGLLVRPSTISGFAAGATPTNAYVVIGAGTTTLAPLKLTSGTSLTSVIAGTVEFDGTNFFMNPSTTRHYVAEGLKSSATLDFASTAAGAATDLTITVTGAADGDLVFLAVPNGSTLANGVFTSWVSAANTVTVRFANTNLASALDPASGSFTSFVVKK